MASLKLGDNPTEIAQVFAIIQELGAGSTFDTDYVKERVTFKKANVTASLHSLWKQGFIERVGRKMSKYSSRGQYVYKAAKKIVDGYTVRVRPKVATRDRMHGYKRGGVDGVPVVRTPKQIIEEILARLVELESVTSNPLKNYTDPELMQELMNRHQQASK